PDHADPGRRGGHRDPARPDGQLHHRRTCALGLLDVEAHVLGDAHAPRVVKLGDRVVQAHARGVHEGRWYSRPMDAQALETEAQSAIAAAPNTTELVEV